MTFFDSNRCRGATPQQRGKLPQLGQVLLEMRLEMRLQIAGFLILLVAMGSFGSGCRSSRTPAAESSIGSDGGAGSGAVFVGRFSGQRAWKHLEALAAIGPRAVGTPGAAKAREYISSELAALGLEVEPDSRELKYGDDEAPTMLELVNLGATIPGKSSDLILLIAPYDSAYFENFRYVGVNDGASGAAVLLELARVLVAKPLPYTTRLLFLDGEAPFGRGSGDDLASSLFGSRAAASKLAGDLANVRLLLHLNRVSDSDLRIARDRFSHRIYRDAFWKAAGRHGHHEVFPVDTSFEAPESGHRSFFDRGMRRVVTIEDTGMAAGETKLARYTEDDTLDRSSEESLALVGQVVLSGLREISASLEKVDRFSEAPTIPAQDVPADERLDGAETPAADTETDTKTEIETESAVEAQAEAASSNVEKDTAPAEPQPAPEESPEASESSAAGAETAE
jgi:glutaminyl-peptide cyclotransferase